MIIAEIDTDGSGTVDFDGKSKQTMSISSIKNFWHDRIKTHKYLKYCRCFWQRGNI